MFVTLFVTVTNPVFYKLLDLYRYNCKDLTGPVDNDFLRSMISDIK